MQLNSLYLSLWDHIYLTALCRGGKSMKILNNLEWSEKKFIIIAYLAYTIFVGMKKVNSTLNPKPEDDLKLQSKYRKVNIYS